MCVTLLFLVFICVLVFCQSFLSDCLSVFVIASVAHFLWCFGTPTLSSAPSPLKEGKGMAENRWEFLFFGI